MESFINLKKPKQGTFPTAFLWGAVDRFGLFFFFSHRNDEHNNKGAFGSPSGLNPLGGQKPADSRPAGFRPPSGFLPNAYIIFFFFLFSLLLAALASRAFSPRQLKTFCFEIISTPFSMVL